MADAAYCDEECSRLQWQMKLTSLKLKKKAFLPALVYEICVISEICVPLIPQTAQV